MLDWYNKSPVKLVYINLGFIDRSVSESGLPSVGVGDGNRGVEGTRLVGDGGHVPDTSPVRGFARGSVGRNTSYPFGTCSRWTSWTPSGCGCRRRRTPWRHRPGGTYYRWGGWDSTKRSQTASSRHTRAGRDTSPRALLRGPSVLESTEGLSCSRSVSTLPYCRYCDLRGVPDCTRGVPEYY